MTRIAISGAHRVGKSTLIAGLNAEVAVVGNVMRGLAQAGYPVAARATPSTMAAYMDAQMASQASAVGAADMVSDRVLADGVAYIRAAINTGLATYPWGEGELQLLAAAARMHAAFFDAHVIVPIEFDTQLDESFHAGGPGYRDAVQAELNLLLQEWPIPVVTVSGSVRQRVLQLSAHLSSQTGISSDLAKEL